MPGLCESGNEPPVSLKATYKYRRFLQEGITRQKSDRKFRNMVHIVMRTSQRWVARHTHQVSVRPGGLESKFRRTPPEIPRRGKVNASHWLT
ncbi:hypothetical protein ANN_15346 [Periplaneta americana]|uniref:Transposase n=1 Tax=Periplaneta americana TaxID=6978 RepID=A0ABQ8SG58_PERAM|nr:hypothetical protein ANN_15346 [Periplaneta americana]